MSAFPIAIDSTMRSTYRSCPQKFFRAHIENWAVAEKGIHLRAGGAFASGMEAARRAHFEKRLSPEACIAEGAKEALKEYGAVEGDFEHQKSPDSVLIALDDYFRTYGWDSDPIQPLRLSDGTYALEFSFALPIPGVMHPESGDPLLYAGRFDMLGEFNGQLFVVDEKTTGYLGNQWFKQWTLRSQLTGYCWAARSYGYEVAGAIIRGVSVQKSGIKHATVIEYRPQWQIDRWMNQLQRDARGMIANYYEGYFDYALDNACADFGGCPFMEVCTSANPERWLEANFIKREWSPLRVVEEG